jgi:ABC-type cobalt transport system substrate-binding protein
MASPRKPEASPGPLPAPLESDTAYDPYMSADSDSWSMSPRTSPDSPICCPGVRTPESGCIPLLFPCAAALGSAQISAFLGSERTAQALGNLAVAMTLIEALKTH